MAPGDVQVGRPFGLDDVREPKASLPKGAHPVAEGAVVFRVCQFPLIVVFKVFAFKVANPRS